MPLPIDWMRSRTSARARALPPPLDPPRTGRRPAIPSLVKWTGSKRSQAHAIRSLFPAFRRYFEPFLGGGALLYLAGGDCLPRRAANTAEGVRFHVPRRALRRIGRMF